MAEPTPTQHEELAGILMTAFVRSPLLTRDDAFTKADARLFRNYLIDVCTERNSIVASSLLRQLTSEPLSNLIEALNKLRNSYDAFLAQKNQGG